MSQHKVVELGFSAPFYYLPQQYLTFEFTLNWWL